MVDIARKLAEGLVVLIGDMLGEVGGPGSGNWGHGGVKGQLGGSSPGGGLGALGVAADASPDEKQAAVAARREEVAQAKVAKGGGASGLYTEMDERIRQRAIGVGNETIEVAAIGFKMSQDEVRRELGGSLRDLAQNGVIEVRAGPKAAAGIIQDGRFKTQFETWTSGGLCDPQRRRWAENHGLGAPEDLPDKKRPVYGYMRQPDNQTNAIINDRVADYGSVGFVMKDSVKDHATMTVGDSLKPFYSSRAIGTSLRNPKVEECIDSMQLTDRPLPGSSRKVTIGKNGYVEAQIHGGAKLSDVGKIMFHGNAQAPRKAGPQNAKEFPITALKAAYRPIYQQALAAGISVELSAEY